MYGVWVTVVFGAAHALCDLAKSVGSGAASVASKAAAFVGHVSGTSSSRGRGRGDATGDAMGSTSQKAAIATATSNKADPSTAEVLSGAVSADVAAADREVVAPAAAWGQTGQQLHQQDLLQANNSLHSRPTAKFFNEVMSCVVPLYLMMLGSVVFFASM